MALSRTMTLSHAPVPPTTLLDSYYTDNMLFQLIRARAGSKMLREAESINMYDEIWEYMDENQMQAVDRAKQFHEHYPVPEVETPMTPMTMEEICTMDPKELQELPWVYVYVLQTLTGHDELTGRILNDLLSCSPAAAWRLPLAAGVSNADAFPHVYDEWLKHNAWVQSFEETCKDIAQIKERLAELGEDCPSSCGCTRQNVCMDCTSGGGEGPPPPRYDYFGFLTRNRSE
jgi:hypothetical protein